jgi:hypothetical protein
MLVNSESTGNRPGPIFNTQLQFTKRIDLQSDQFYEFEFSYIINYDVCEKESVVLSVFLFDNIFFKELIFESNQTSTDEEIYNSRWNSRNICFEVFGKEYFLFLNAISSCRQNNSAFVAIDNIKIVKIDNINVDKCKDLKVTLTPQTTIGITTIDETTFIDKLETTDETTLETYTAAISTFEAAYESTIETSSVTPSTFETTIEDTIQSITTSIFETSDETIIGTSLPSTYETTLDTSNQFTTVPTTIGITTIDKTDIELTTKLPEVSGILMLLKIRIRVN